MTIEIEPHSGAERPDEVRRRLLLSGLAGGAAFAMSRKDRAGAWERPALAPVRSGSDGCSRRTMLARRQCFSRPMPRPWLREQSTRLRAATAQRMCS